MTTAKEETTNKTQQGAKPKASTGTEQPRVVWDTSNLKSSYANVCTVTSTREEVVLNFGINQAWERGQNNMKVELTDRVILSPFAAMRMYNMLKNLLDEYQTRYGVLEGGDAPMPEGTTKQ